MIYDCNTHSCLWYFNFIAIPSFVCPKLACIEWLISLNNDRHLFADSFVTVRQIAMKFGWDKENVSCLKLRKFCLNPTNFKRKLTMMSKLDLKKITLTEFRTPVQNGLMQTVKIFCTENEHLHAFNAPTKIVQIGWGHHVDFCFWKKSAITFGEGCMVIHIYGITLNTAKSADQYYSAYSYQSSSLISYFMYNDLHHDCKPYEQTR